MDLKNPYILKFLNYFCTKLKGEKHNKSAFLWSGEKKLKNPAFVRKIIMN